jgi:pilus assembly protein CpaD
MIPTDLRAGLLTSLALLATAACEATPPAPADYRAAYQPRISAERTLLTLPPAPAGGGIAPAALAEAAARLGALGGGPALHLRAGAPVSPAELADLQSLALASGIPLANLDLRSGDASPPGVELEVVHWRIAPVGCPTWADLMDNFHSNAPTYELGCANARNLQLMVADPSDLLGGRVLDPASGGREAAAIERYRTDQVKPFLGTTATGAQGAGMK